LIFDVVTLAAPYVRPWKPPRNAMIPGLPVTRRASFSAPSIASEPEFRNMTESRGSGNVAASSTARREIGSANPSAETGPISRSTCAWMAVVTAGWACPSDVTAIPLAKSRYARPSLSYNRCPTPWLHDRRK